MKKHATYIGTGDEGDDVGSITLSEISDLAARKYFDELLNDAEEDDEFEPDGDENFSVKLTKEHVVFTAYNIDGDVFYIIANRSDYDNLIRD